MAIFTISKIMARILKQLNQFVCKDNIREKIEVVHVDQNKKLAMATDGLKLCFMRIDNLKDFEEVQSGDYKVGIGSIGRSIPIASFDKIDGLEFPDLFQILPKNDAKILCQLTFNPKLLISAINDAQGTVTMTIFEHTLDKNSPGIIGPVELQYSIEGVNFHALIMPMHTGNKKWSVKE